MAKKAYVGVPMPVSPLGSVSVGDIVKINENGSPVDYLVIQQGNPDSSLYDGTCDGTWLLRKDMYSMTVTWDVSSSNNYEVSDIHTYINSTMFGLYDDNIKSIITSVKIPHQKGGGSDGSIYSGANGLSTKLFLLSAFEVGFTKNTNQYIPVDGVKLDYFTTANAPRIAYYEGKAGGWWLRSAHMNGNNGAFYANSSGGLSNLTVSSENCGVGVRPAFVVPSHYSVVDGELTSEQIEVGSLSTARQIKKGYVGIPTEFPIYGDPVAIDVTVNNIAEFFTVTNGSYYFKGTDGTFVNTNSGVDSSTATTKLTAKEDTEVSFYYSYASEASYDKFTLVVAGKTIENAVSGASTTKSYSGSLKAGESIEFTYSKDSSTSSNGDRCAFSTIKIFKEQILDTEFRDVSRAIKKAYIGIGGVARPCFGGSLAYYGTITPLAEKKDAVCAVHVPNSYALFIGGETAWDNFSTAEAYSKSLTKTTPASTWYAWRRDFATASVGKYGIVAGGSYGSTPYSYVDAWDNALVNTRPNNLQQGTRYHAGASVGAYCLFAGGMKSSSSSYEETTITAYDESLTRISTVTNLSVLRIYLGGASVGGYALFGGGHQNNSGNRLEVVDAYNESLTRSIAPELSKRSNGSAYEKGASAEGYAMFAFEKTFDAYNASLSRTVLPTPPSDATYATAVGIGEYILIAGGAGDGSTRDATVSVFDGNMTLQAIDNLSAGRYRIAATTVGDYALFAGGDKANNSYTDAVDAYTIG